jgi:hypothetical protein
MRISSVSRLDCELEVTMDTHRADGAVPAAFTTISERTADTAD